MSFHFYETCKPKINLILVNQCKICKELHHTSQNCPYKHKYGFSQNSNSMYQFCSHCNSRTDHNINNCPYRPTLLFNNQPFGSYHNNSHQTCGLCHNSSHKTHQHRCKKCHRDGAHRTRNCPY